MNKKETLVVGLYGGPGIAKSTIMAGVFAELKIAEVNCEMVPEFAKEKIWEQSIGTLKNQIYMFAKQYHAIERLINQVDVIITDSPLLLALVYDITNIPEFSKLVLAVNNKLNTMNFLLNRQVKYSTSGRRHNEEEAIKIDNKIKKMLDNNSIVYRTINGNKYAIRNISKTILRML
jgi:nicotinamide riboside kinase